MASSAGSILVRIEFFEGYFNGANEDDWLGLPSCEVHGADWGFFASTRGLSFFLGCNDAILGYGLYRPDEGWRVGWVEDVGMYDPKQITLWNGLETVNQFTSECEVPFEEIVLLDPEERPFLPFVLEVGELIGSDGDWFGSVRLHLQLSLETGELSVVGRTPTVMHVDGHPRPEWVAAYEREVARKLYEAIENGKTPRARGPE